MNYLEVIKSFVVGEMTIEEFEKYYRNNTDFQEYLHNNMPERVAKNPPVRLSPTGSINYYLTYDAKWRRTRDKYGIIRYMSYYLDNNNISYIPTDYYEKKIDWLLMTKPDCIDGDEADEYVVKIIDSVPETIPKTKRIKEIKDRIKTEFHLERYKYPRFFNVPEWPFNKNGKPLKYFGRLKQDGDLVLHDFIDLETNEHVIIEEYY